MNWREEAISRLRQYDGVRKAAVNLPGEVERIRTNLESPGSARTDIPGGSAKSREDWLLGQLQRLEELERQLAYTRAWLAAMDGALSALTPEEKLVLHRLFICPGKGNAERLCEELNAERSSVYRKRDAALTRFTTALYGPT